MDVTFEVAGKTYVVAEAQATILAENLRVLSKSEFAAASDQAVLLGPDDDWRVGAEKLADSIESALVDGTAGPLTLAGMPAEATYLVLRLMVGLDTDGAAGLRDALGTPVPPKGSRLLGAAPAQLSRPEMIELLTILFVMAILTVIAGVEWTASWYFLAPVIAALLGLRVATTRATGRFAWSMASVAWFGVLLVPAAVVVTLLALLVLTIVKN